MTRDTRLVDVDSVDDVIDRLLTAAKRLDDAQAHGIGQDLEDCCLHDMHMHTRAYYGCQGRAVRFDDRAGARVVRAGGRSPPGLGTR